MVVPREVTWTSESLLDVPAMAPHGGQLDHLNVLVLWPVEHRERNRSFCSAADVTILAGVSFFDLFLVFPSFFSCNNQQELF